MRHGPDWLAAGTSVRGDAHRRTGAPNQDAILVLPGDRGDPLVAIADGHGSERSFRSDVGARLAVTAAAACARRSAQSMNASDIAAAERLAKRIARDIVKSWREQALADLHRREFTSEELARLRDVDDDAIEALDQEPLIAYGATLLLAIVLPRRITMLQIGDGDVLLVCASPNGPTVARPIPADERLVGNVTTSLCVAGAEDDFRVSVHELNGRSDAELVLMTTDGYANSFVDDAAFLQTGPDVFQMLQEHGGDWVGEQLLGWLEAASRQGSGDDITMGLLWRHEGNPSATGRGAASSPTISADPGRAELVDRRGPVATRRTRGVRRLLRLGLIPAALAVGIALGWLLFGDSQVPRGERVVSETVAPTPSIAEAARQGPVWVWDGSTGLLELDRGEPTGRALEVAELRGSGGVRDIEEGFGFLWVALARDAVLKIDPTDPTSVEEIALPAEPAGVSITHRRVVVSADTGGTVFLIDPETLELSVVHVTDRMATEGR